MIDYLLNNILSLSDQITSFQNAGSTCVHIVTGTSVSLWVSLVVVGKSGANAPVDHCTMLIPNS